MTTFQSYIQKALALAEYHYDEETKSWVGEIAELPLCWAQGDSVEEVRAELAETVEGWVLLAIRQGDPIPKIAGALPIGVLDHELAHA